MSDFFPKQFRLTSFIVLAVLLFSITSHSHDFSTEHSAEQFECKLCQQNIDKPSVKIALQSVNITTFWVSLSKLASQQIQLEHYALPHSRAPPISV